MTFEYMQRVVVEANLEVDNVGDCVLQANNDFGNEYYLLIKTELGWSEVLEYGPCIPDIQILPLDYKIAWIRVGFQSGISGKEPTCQSRRHKRHRFDSWVRKIPSRRAWQPSPVLLPEESHGQRSLVGYSL